MNRLYLKPTPLRSTRLLEYGQWEQTSLSPAVYGITPPAKPLLLFSPSLAFAKDTVKDLESESTYLTID